MLYDAKQGDAKIDALLDGKAQPEESSPEDVAQDAVNEEATRESTEETNLDKKGVDKEEAKPEIPKEFHKHPAWQRILKERDEFKMKFETQTQEKGSQEELKKLVEEVKQVTSSPTYIRTKMEADGYKPEVIDEQLRKMGHNVPEKTEDVVGMVAEKLNINLKGLAPEQKTQVENYIHDIASIASVLIENKIGKEIPNYIKPLQETVGTVVNEYTANRMVKEFRDVTKEEGVLDFDKEVEPELHKYLDANPNTTMDDLKSYFFKVSHKLALERLSAKTKKEERDVKKQSIGVTPRSQSVPISKQIKGTGNPDKDLDAILDSAGIL